MKWIYTSEITPVSQLKTTEKIYIKLVSGSTMNLPPPPTTPKRKPGTRIYNFHLYIIKYYEHVTSEITTETTDLCLLKMNIKQTKHAKNVLLFRSWCKNMEDWVTSIFKNTDHN